MRTARPIDVSAIVVDYRGGELLDRCLRHLRAALLAVDGETELIVVDNAGALSEVSGARLVSCRENRGFAGGVVAGMAVASGEWIALVNNDAFVEEDCVRRMLETGRGAPDIGSVAPLILFERHPRVVNSAGLEIDRLGIGYDRLAGRSETAAAQPAEVFGATGCVALHRRAALDGIGGFDAAFFAFQEDADVAWRARMAGWRCRFEPRARSLHRGSSTAKEASRMKFFLVGRNRMRLLARNATTAQLRRHGASMFAYDLAYVAFVALAERSLAPLSGRLAGLRDWRRYRAMGADGRRDVPLASGGWRHALAMRRAYAGAAG